MGEKLRRGPVTHDEWDHLCVIIGRRKYGKTAFALDLALDLGEQPAYIICHDPGRRVEPWTPRRGYLPKGTLHHHQTVYECRAALVTHPRGVHLVAGLDAEPVLEFALSLGKTSLALGGGTRGVPVVAWVNEATSCASSSPNHFDGLATFVASQGRHDLVGLIIECQTPRRLNHTILSNFTSLDIFAQMDLDALKRLKGFGVNDELLARAAKLQKYEHIHVEP